MTAKGRKETSARARLALLPPVFSARDVPGRFGWSPASAQVALHRWHHRDALIRPLGGRSEVYFNLLVEANWHAHFESALKLAVPMALTVGHSAYSNGWVSQPPTTRHLAVPCGTPLYAIEGCQFHPRRREWFAAVAAGIEHEQHTIPELRPGWALADALLAKAAYERGRLQRPRAFDGAAGLQSFVLDPEELYADECSPADICDFTDAVQRLKSLYGFSALLIAAPRLTMRVAYTSVHSFILEAPAWWTPVTFEP